jgi:hypothetical protein
MKFEKKGDLLQPGGLLGKKKEPEVIKSDLAKNIVFEKTDVDYESNLKYNEDILNFHPYMANFMPRENHVVVRLFKQESDATTEGGLILGNDIEWYETQGGQMKVRNSQNFYQTRGVVVRVGFCAGDERYVSLIKPNAIVRVATNKLGEEFDVEPWTKGITKDGYFMIHVGVISGIELN